MTGIDENDLMTCSIFSSAEPTPLSSLSAASSYSSLVNCDEPTERGKQETTEVVYDNINKRSSHSTLLPRHVNKLCSILEQPIDIHGQGSFPTLTLVSKDFLIELRRAFHLQQIEIRDIRLNGGKTSSVTIFFRTRSCVLGAASYVLTNDKSFSYTDVDFIFRCDLSSEAKWTQIKTIVCECLSRRISATSFSPVIIQAAYMEKVVRVTNPTNQDSWALISLCNVNGQNIELKFVDRMKRQFQFSVDSFQISIDPLLDYYAEMSKYQQTLPKKYQYHHYGESHSVDSSCCELLSFVL